MKPFALFLVGCSFVAAQTPQSRGVELPKAARAGETGTARRLALVIGNDAYAGNVLHNAVNDARAMKTALDDSGFSVQIKLNATQQQMETTIDEFTGSVNPGDIALFFYAGHGMQISDQNYLIPVDFQARTAVDAKYKAYPAQRVQENLEAAGVAMQIIILDACRNNPFRSLRGGGDGLAAMQAGRGTYIAFATSPGKTAADSGIGQNGLFTGELVQVLSQPGLTIDDVFNRVREQVSRKSKNQQLPWSTSSVTGQFYFKGTIQGSFSVAPAPNLTGERELTFWNSIKDESDAQLFQEYLQRYPNGEFVRIAKAKLDRLRSAAVSVPQPPTQGQPSNASPGKEVPTRSGPQRRWIGTPFDSARFAPTLKEVIRAARSNFQPIKGDLKPNSDGEAWDATVTLPGVPANEKCSVWIPRDDLPPYYTCEMGRIFTPRGASAAGRPSDPDDVEKTLQEKYVQLSSDVEQTLGAGWQKSSRSSSSRVAETVFSGNTCNCINGGAIIDHEAPRERRFVAVEK